MCDADTLAKLYAETDVSGDELLDADEFRTLVTKLVRVIPVSQSEMLVPLAARTFFPCYPCFFVLLFEGMVVSKQAQSYLNV